MEIRIAKGSMKLEDIPEGSLFLYKNTLALKSEYLKPNGDCKCFIVGSGEVFCSSEKELNELQVTLVRLTV